MTGADEAVQNAGVGAGEPDLSVLAALRIEALAIGGKVRLVGMGPVRSQAAGRRLAQELPEGSPVAVLGVSGGLDPQLEPGQVVVASTVRAADSEEVILLPEARSVADEVRRSGIDTAIVDLVSTRTLTRGAERARLFENGVRVVDMESAWLARELGAAHPLAVVRVVADGVRAGYVTGGIKGLAALRHLRPAIEHWASARAGWAPL